MAVNFEDYRLTYNGNGSTDLFPYKWPASSDASFSITKVNTDGTTVSVTSNYTANGIGDDDENNWTILYPTTGTKLQTGEKLIITPDESLLQEVDFSQQGNNNPVVFGQALDKLTIIAQQLTEKVERAITVEQGVDTTPEALLESLQEAEANAAASATAADASADAAQAIADTLATGLTTPAVQASSSAGLAIKNNGGTTVATFGSGGGTATSMTSLALTTPLPLSSGGFGYASQPRFKATRGTSSQTITTATATKLQYNSETWDIGGIYDNATNYRFTVPSGFGGLWAIFGQVNFASLGDCDMELYALINGTTKISRAFYSYKQVFLSPPDKTIELPYNEVSLAAGDYVELWIYQNSGASATVAVDAYRGFFGARFLGAVS